MPCGDEPSLKVSTMPAYWGVAPRKPADWWASVVPVLPAIGRVQPAPLAAAAAVPPAWSSLLMPTASVFANASSTACSQGSSVITTGLPCRSRISSIGVGGHHTPPLMMVAATLLSSSGLVGA